MSEPAFGALTLNGQPLTVDNQVHHVDVQVWQPVMINLGTLKLNGKPMTVSGIPMHVDLQRWAS